MSYRKINLSESAKIIKKPFTHLRLAGMEEFDIKLVVYEGDYFKHLHSRHDEFILVIKGRITIDFDSESVSFASGEGVIIEMGTPHRSRGEGRAEVLVIEKGGIMDDFVRV